MVNRSPTCVNQFSDSCSAPFTTSFDNHFLSYCFSCVDWVIQVYFSMAMSNSKAMLSSRGRHEEHQGRFLCYSLNTVATVRDPFLEPASHWDAITNVMNTRTRWHRLKPGYWCYSNKDSKPNGSMGTTWLKSAAMPLHLLALWSFILLDNDSSFVWCIRTLLLDQLYSNQESSCSTQMVLN